MEYKGHRYRNLIAGQTAEGLEGVDINRIAAIRISLADPKTIVQWGRAHCKLTDDGGECACGKTAKEKEKCPYGEVKTPETINYRTFKPEKDGLFCERIFGPTKDWECSCGKYKRIKYKGIVCERCGVEVTLSKVRRSRMGYIRLAAPVSHIWFFKGTPSRIGNLLDLSLRNLDRVLYYEEYIVTNPGDTPLQKAQLLSEEEYVKYREQYGEKFEAGMGAESVRSLLAEIDMDSLSAELTKEMKEATSQQKQKKIIKRLKVLEAFRSSGNRPEWMILDVVPVIPPDLRPLVPLDGGRFATSDLNDLYRRVINRNNRLKKLISIKAPEVILRNEKRMLQEAVDALFDNGRRGRPIRGYNDRPLKSLSDMLKGKQGRFRQNLLGKRVDYSGRSVIVVGPELRFNQCGLPKKMALELFRPFIIKRLEEKGLVNTIKSAQKMVDREDPEVYDILEEVIKDHPVLLNRAPTLHRLGVQAFMPVLIEGKAIQLHPLSCTAFNADFDGDQMAVHIPLSIEAQMEARFLMLAENNILSPSSGKPVATPSQDIVLGCHYLTKLRAEGKGAGMVFSDPDEVIIAFNLGHIHLCAPIKVRLNGEIIETSVGRILFSRVLPDEISYFNKESKYFNKTLDKSSLSLIVDDCFHVFGNKRTAKVLDSLKDIGYEFARYSGTTIAIDDMVIPEKKQPILDSARKDVSKIHDDYLNGAITSTERYNRIIDRWTQATDEVEREMLVKMRKDQSGFNSIFMMYTSKARGSQQQIRQLAGMRGLMAKPMKKLTGGVGEILETPIVSNFREGLTVLEYFISTHGARKGLADTALKTADAGYLTRRLADVAQDLIITEEDCMTLKGIEIAEIKEVTAQGVRVLESLDDRILGRVAAEDIYHPDSNELLVEANTDINPELSKYVADSGVKSVRIRSVLTCETKRGVCCKCYGRNLATGRMVNVGEAVGIVAAQSIGEPGTQLTLRTFHIGGTASRKLEGWYQAKENGQILYEGLKTVQTPQGRNVVLNRHGAVKVVDPSDSSIVLQTIPNVVRGSEIAVADGEEVKKGQRFIEWDPHNVPIITEFGGKIRFIDLKENVTLKRILDESTMQTQRMITDPREEDTADKELHPQIEILDESGSRNAAYSMPVGATLVRDMKNGAIVEPGSLLARLPITSSTSRDITGGLPRVAELFEARKPADCAVIAEINGTVEFGGIAKGMRKIKIISDTGQEHEYLVPLGKHLTVHNGDIVQAGDRLTEGSIDPHDVLRIKGENALQEFLVNEIQEVYRLQGVTINDKHIESIVRQMLRKVCITDPGDTSFLIGEQVDKHVFQEENARVVMAGGKVAKADSKLLGITKASLVTESFISAASFQETTRVLTEAAVQGQIDRLIGLKENVIMGHLIPAGTGMEVHRSLALRKEGQPEVSVPKAEASIEA